MRGKCSDTDASAPVKLSRTHSLSLLHDKMMEVSRHSRFGMMCEPLMEPNGEELLTWWLEDSRARTCRQQEKAQDLQEATQDYGQKWRGLLARYSPESCSLRTAQCSFIEDLSESLPTLPDWGLMLNGDVYLHPLSAHHITAIESGLLPTPSGTSNHGKNHVSGRLDEWGGSSNPWRGTEIGKTHSASFEEWMMGWPELWTELTVSATDKFQQWQQQHTACSEASE